MSKATPSFPCFLRRGPSASGLSPICPSALLSFFAMRTHRLVFVRRLREEKEALQARVAGLEATERERAASGDAQRAAVARQVKGMERLLLGKLGEVGGEVESRVEAMGQRYKLKLQVRCPD